MRLNPARVFVLTIFVLSSYQQKVDQQCSTNCKTCSTYSKCTSCQEKYLYNGDCYSCSINCLNQSYCSDNGCQMCTTGFVLKLDKEKNVYYCESSETTKIGIFAIFFMYVIFPVIFLVVIIFFAVCCLMSRTSGGENQIEVKIPERKKSGYYQPPMRDVNKKEEVLIKNEI